MRSLKHKWNIATLLMVALTCTSILLILCAVLATSSLTQPGRTLAASTPPLEVDFIIETGEDWDELAGIATEDMSQYDITGSGSIEVLVTPGTKYITTHILWKDNNLPLRIYGEHEAVIDTAEGYAPPFAGGLISNMKLGNPIVTRYPGVMIQVYNITIRNTSADHSGGAIYAWKSTVMVSHSTFENTSAQDGGVINAEHSTLEVSDSTFENSSASQGGAIDIRGSTLKVSDCGFKNNSALGGAVFAENSAMEVVNCTLENLSASQGGAIYAHAGSIVKVLNCTFRESIGSSGSAIYARDSTLEVSGNVFSGVRGDSLVSSPGSQGSFENNEIVDDGTDKLVSLNPQLIYKGNTVDSGIAKFDLLMDEYVENEGVTITSDKWYSDKGLLLVGGIFTVKNMVFQEVSINGYGGAISTIGVSGVVVSDCSFENISASQGGAISVMGSSDVEVSNCSFENTNASQGGAIAVGGSDVEVSDCSFWKTSAESGGAVFAWSSTVRVSASTFKNTSASSEGGAIYAGGYAIVWIESSDFVECLDQDNKTFYTHEAAYQDNTEINTVGYDKNTPNAYVVKQGMNLRETHEIYPGIRGGIYLSGESFTEEFPEEPSKFPIWVVVVVVIGIAGVAAAGVFDILKSRSRRTDF